MERRELYDPEDIEQLLFERPYDSLLEEERAFVLRHLSGRAEYEAMRALLLRVHEDEGPVQATDADPGVREHVLAAFRAEQRPQWRIWLNTIGAALWPREVSAIWRPALALASIAAVVTVGLIAYRSTSNMERPALAEVKQEKTVAPAPPATGPDRSRTPIVAEATDSAPAAASAADQPVADVPVKTLMDEQRQASTSSGATTVTSTWSSEEGAVATSPAEPPTVNEDLAETEKAEDGKAVARDDANGIAAPDSQVMTEMDLARNMSTANTRERVVSAAKPELAKESRKFKKDLSGAGKDQGAGTDVTALVGLLRAAW